MILLPMPIAACKPENMIMEKGIDDIGDDPNSFHPRISETIFDITINL